MAQLNGFMNLTQIRKLTQQTLKPIISQIEQQMSLMKKQSEFLKGQSEKARLMEEKQRKFQQYIVQDSQDMRNVKIKLQQLKDQDLKNMLITKKQLSSLNQQVQALKRQRAKFQQILLKQRKQNQRTLQQLKKYQLWMDQKVDTMNNDYLNLKQQTLTLTSCIKSDYSKIQTKFQQITKSVQQKMLVNDKKYQILGLYLQEREQISLKMLELENRFGKYAQNDRIQYLRMCQIKELEMNKNEISNMLDVYLPPHIKEMLPIMEQRVKQIDKIANQIKQIKQNVFQSQQQINHFKQSTQSLQSNFRKQCKQLNSSLSTHIQILKKDVQVALAIDQKQTLQRKKFQQTFSSQLTSYVLQQNQKAYQKIHQQTNHKIEQQKKQDNSLMIRKQQQFQKKCIQIKDISDNIQKLLHSYNSRIVKVRSDSELFKNQVLKEMKLIANIRNQNTQRFQDLGKVLASLLEIITTNLTIDVNLDRDAVNGDNFAFSTYNDGLIYQLIPYNSQFMDSNNLNQITYRRKQLQIPHLRRCILTSAVNLIDRIYQSYPYLQWKQYKPSNFFKQQILSAYKIQVQKYSSIPLSIIPHPQSLIPSTIANQSSKNAYQLLSIAHQPLRIANQPSTPLKQTFQAINLPLQTNNKQSYQQSLEKNITIQTKNNFIKGQQQNIKRMMKTIQEQDNRFVLSGFGNRSREQQLHGNRTIEQIPMSAGSTRKRYLAKSKKDLNHSRYHNDTETFMTSRSTRRTSIGHYKL